MRLVLIGTLWNVNDCVDKCCICRNSGFNRYIVECKYKEVREIKKFAKSFNRYIVECKLNRILEIECGEKVLIGTLWNVNLHSAHRTDFQGMSFNRYIVECKFKLFQRFLRGVRRFNRYIVECKYLCHSIYNRLFNRFNRYIVECKYFPYRFPLPLSESFNRYIVECKCRQEPTKILLSSTF